MGRNEELADRARNVLVGNYKQQPIAIERGEGCYLYDAEGRRYLDMIAGIATVSLGHCHPKVVAALEAQSKQLWHASNVVYTLPQIELAERICSSSFAERVFFCNSGAEANEAALKLARRWQRDRGQDRFEIIAFQSSFHGRTLFTVTATGQPKYWEGFEPMVPGVHHAKYGDLASVEALIGPKTAAIIVEPVQGEGGVRPAPKGFLAGLRKLADEHGLVLIFDEVQTGMGRTGPLFAYQRHGVEPDVMTLAKALGNGIPIGAMCTREELARSLVPGTHASTFGGNPLAAACASAVFDELLDGGVLERGQIAGEYLAARLGDMARRLGPEKVVEARGQGLLHGVELLGPAAPVISRCRELGVIVNAAGEKVVRLAPPLIIEHVQIDEAVDVLERAIRES
ncbi:aspartate aminotransferase family protein [Vulgatibacter incomptus]|uniref:Acetylornithine aminotransferase n=1 Tax=Vulgatibacter incomptus TaxID=1391653 RepID=A0A0K1P8D3_9BACT|nr:aspartate aminotransferase family protein [Vulgatibacter incomptus]AKU89775.1 Acetylornithine aminotransferase [Vulgatibacter incomptus]